MAEQQEGKKKMPVYALEDLPPSQRKDIDEVSSAANEVFQELSGEVPEEGSLEEDLEAESKAAEHADSDEVQPEPCKRCGFDNSKPYVVPDEEDAKQFVRATLANQPFEKEYELFGGAVRVLLRHRTADEADTIFDQLDMDKKAELIANTIEYNLRMLQYNIAADLVHVKNKDGGILCQNDRKEWPEHDEAATVLSAGRVYTMKSMTEALYSAVMETVRSFEALVDALVKLAHKPDFWTSAGEI